MNKYIEMYGKELVREVLVYMFITDYTTKRWQDQYDWGYQLLLKHKRITKKTKRVTVTISKRYDGSGYTVHMMNGSGQYKFSMYIHVNEIPQLFEQTA